MDEPLFRHPRLCCKYLGRVGSPGDGGEADAYYCPHVRVLVVRHGDGPDDYASFSSRSGPNPRFATDPRLDEALKLAVAAGWVDAPEPAR